MNRDQLCRSLVRSGARTVRDGWDHSQSASRCIAGGKCVGFYAVLTDYDSQSDMFNRGMIKASHVDEVGVFDSIMGLIGCLK
jgi:hypothetical protein